MRNACVVLVAAAGLLVLLGQPALADPPGSGAPAPVAPAPKRTYVVAAIGDSLTDAASHGGKYLQYLAERCPKSRFDNYGKGGQMVNQMRARFGHDVLGDPPDPADPKPAYTHVIVFGGVNDVGSDTFANRTVTKIEADLQTMYSAARSKGMKVIAISVAPWAGFRKLFNPRRGEETKAVNRWIGAQLRAGRVDHVVDAYKLMSCGDPQRLCPSWSVKDGLHFNAAGHQRLGEELHSKAFSDCE